MEIEMKIMYSHLSGLNLLNNYLRPEKFNLTSINIFV